MRLVVVTGVLASLVVAGSVAEAPQSGAAGRTAVSASKAVELAAAMVEGKIEVIAGRDTTPGRFVAAMLIPDIQLMVVSAGYERTSDIEYYLYTKDFLSAYRSLRSSPLAKDPFIVDDAEANGLVALPGRNPRHDTVTMGATERVFDGLIADPRRRNSKGSPEDVYMKAYTDADARYAGALGALIGLVKKGPQALAATGGLR